MRDVDVLIPTMRRPDHLARALRSVFLQEGASALIASIVVIDNSPEASARALVEAFRPACPVDLVYVHESQPGVATARNAGLKASRAAYVAFLDDDEEAPPQWLAQLRQAHLALGSTVTFGPVRGVAADARPAFRAYLDRFFSRVGGAQTELIDEVYGCGNSIMTRAEALSGPAPFDVRSDLTGGEDDRLFAHLQNEGRAFGWAAEAFVYEYAPPHRARLRYALKRAFCYGQSPSQTCLHARDWLGLVRSMVIGAGQAGVYGCLAMVLLALGRVSQAVNFIDRAARGVGKVFWPLRVELYGLAAATP